MSDYPAWLVEGVEAELDADIRAAWDRLRRDFAADLKAEMAGERVFQNGLAEWMPPVASDQALQDYPVHALDDHAAHREEYAARVKRMGSKLWPQAGRELDELDWKRP